MRESDEIQRTEMDVQQLAHYFKSLKLLNYIDWALFSASRSSPDKLEDLAARLTKHSTNTGLDLVTFQSHLRKEIEHLKKQAVQANKGIEWRELKARASRQRPSPLLKYLRSHVAQLHGELGKLPGGEGKALAALRGVIQSGFDNYRDSVYEAFCFLKSEVSATVSQEVIADWKAQRQRFSEWLQYPKGLAEPKIFWDRSREHSVQDGVARYRFKSEFSIGGFESAFDEFESELSESLSGSIDRDSLRSLAYDLCTISRSRHLVQRIQPALERALDSLVNQQVGPSWREFAQDEERLPVQLASVGTTAAAALALLRLGTKDAHTASGTAAASWLLEKQNTDGSWNLETYHNFRPKSEPDLFTTISAMESVWRSGIPGASHSIDLGRKWINAHQSPNGLWEEDGYALPQPTVLILETFRSLDQARPALTNTYLSASRGYIKRSLMLVNDQDATSRRLAIVSAHLAIESFLYGLIQVKNITKLFDKGQTIGMRAAQTALQTWLQSQKFLKPNELIPYSNELGRLAYLRDEVVHKALQVGHNDVTDTVQAAAEFMSDNSIQILGFDCLE